MFRLFLVLALVSPSLAADIILKPGNLTAVLKEARMAPKPVRIVVENGIHPITETITLGKDDSQVTWSGENAVFMAGKPITGWVKEGKIWKAALPDKVWKFEQLWINGRLATRARAPNKGYFHITDAVGAGVFPDLTKDMNFHAFSVAQEQYDMIKAIPAEQRDNALITVTHAWAVGQCRI